MTAGRQWLGAVVLAVLATGPSRGAQPQPGPEIAEIAARDLQLLSAKLNDPDASQEERDEAARRLVSRRSAQARQIVADALVNLNPQGQLAAAQALAEDSQPEAAMIDPLFAALGPGTNRALTEAAARALSNYKNDPEVVRRLIDYVEGRQSAEAARIAAIRALGSIPQKRSAEFLISLLSRANEPAGVIQSATAALADLSGLPEGEEAGANWAQWWELNGDKSEAQFRADLLAQRAARDDRARAQSDAMAREFETFLREQYRATPLPQRPELLLRYLRSSLPHVRVVGAAIVNDEALLENKSPAPAVREQLRAMIGDSSPPVRAAAAEAFSRINDAAALEALLAQLSQEPDARVRAALATALAPINDVRAVPVLLEMLRDPSYNVAQASADALRQLGPAIRGADAALASRTAAALREALESRTGTPDTLRLRQTLVAAMVPLRQEDLRPLLTSMLEERRGESMEVRYLAIRALGEIANPQSAALLVTALGDRSSERIRLEAVTALGKNPALPEYALALRPLLDPQHEPDESVRTAAWVALENAFSRLPKAQLNIWVDRFKDDPARHLVALKALETQHLADKDEDNLATTRETIGAVLMTQRQHKEAAAYFGLALDFKKSQRAPAAAINQLMRERLRALLLAKDFPAVVQFSGESLKDTPGSALDVGALIWTEAQTMAQAGDLQGALDLISAVNKMTPPLAEEYRAKLASIEKDVQARMSRQNVVPPPAGPRSADAAVPANGQTAGGN